MAMTSSPETDRIQVLEAAKEITDGLRARTDEGERNGRLPDSSIEALQKSGMLSLWRPRDLGGLECDPLTYALAVEEIATADTAAAWLMHGVPASWMDIRTGTEAFIDEVVSSAKVPILAGTYNKPMKAEPVDGGVQVTGSTPFASGCKFADWIAHTALEGERFLLVVHPAGELEIEEDWNSLGLRGTCSNTISARGVFVPGHRIFDLGKPGPLHPAFQGPLYRLPGLIIPCAVSAVILGTLRVSLEALKDLAQRKTPFGSPSSLKHRSLAQHRYGEAYCTYRACRTLLHAVVSEAFERAKRGGDFDLQERTELVAAYTFTQQKCLEAVRLLARAAGTTGIYQGHPLERTVRDAEVISHHVFGAESRYANIAQAHWGIEVDFPMLANG